MVHFMLLHGIFRLEEKVCKCLKCVFRKLLFHTGSLQHASKTRPVYVIHTRKGITCFILHATLLELQALLVFVGNPEN